ncbi:MAG TPA: alkaline phosphatase D family protein [Caulobacterales bacterium]|nr:alkaline phosphatase D family protein [Caulobacterales bacterium]
MPMRTTDLVIPAVGGNQEESMGGGVTRRSALGVALASAAAACGAKVAKAPPYKGAVRFLHGVASGDPLADRVIIWTRVSPDREGPVPVRWAVARDARLTRRVASGYVSTVSGRDYTVKVDVPKLKPGQVYYYGFLVNDVRSPVGRTKTLPQGGIDRITIAAVSCANYPAGFFNVYEAVAKLKDVDVILHLGDYIYEYGVGEYDHGEGVALGRTPEPPVETVTLADYRTRYRQYHTDPDLQAAHASAPFICVWDDHEVCDDAWKNGGANHNPETGEGDFEARKRAALQAYYEWVPIRDPEAGKPIEACYRAFQFGSLARLIMVETRLLARSRQLDYARDMPLLSTTWDMTDPRAPKRVAAGAPAPKAVQVRPTPFDARSGAPRPVLDWKLAAAMDPRAPPAGFTFLPDVAAFKKKLNDPARAMLGKAQEDWLADQLIRAQQAHSTWAVLGNQVLMARLALPPRAGLSPVEQAAMDKSWPQIAQAVALGEQGLPPTLDTWDGYPAQRDRLYDIFAKNDANVIVMTGDSHEAWANELMRAGARVADEFGVSSITSPSVANDLPADPDLNFEKFLTRGEVKWTEAQRRGFTVLTLTKSSAKADFYAVSTIVSKDYEVEKIASFTVKPEKGPAVGALEKTA